MGEFLANDVRRIVIETDEAEPVVIARLEETPDGSLYPAEGYRIRVAFKDDEDCLKD